MNIGHEPIVWNEAMMTGVVSIDEQHQILVNMLNLANARLTENVSRSSLEDIVRDLMSYAVYHFDTEEELMVDNDYTKADREQHFQEHRSFSTKIAEIQQDINQGKLLPREELLSFLNNWLVNHIMHTDKKLGQFLNSH